MGRHRKLNLQQEQDVINLYKNMSQKDIAKRYDLTQAGVFVILKRYGIIKYKNSRLNMSKLKLDIDYFKHIDSKDKAYWLGFICADGSINKQHNKTTITSKDKDILLNFKKCIKSEHTISTISKFDRRTSKTYLTYSIQICNELFTRHLVNLQINDIKSKVLKFPKLHTKFISYFIAGLFDGDGSISIKKNKLTISLMSTFEMLTYIQEYLFNTKYINKLNICKITNKSNYNLYKMYLYKDSINFLNFIYNDKNFKYYLKRKYNLFKKYG